MLYRLFFQNPLCDRAGQNASVGLKLGLGGIAVEGQLVMSRSASDEIELCENLAVQEQFTENCLSTEG